MDTIASFHISTWRKFNKCSNKPAKISSHVLKLGRIVPRFQWQKIQAFQASSEWCWKWSKNSICISSCFLGYKNWNLPELAVRLVLSRSNQSREIKNGLPKSALAIQGTLVRIRKSIWLRFIYISPVRINLQEFLFVSTRNRRTPWCWWYVMT